MCGLVGVLNLSSGEPVNADRLARANDTLAHRGPDDAGIWVARNIGLAARRLSIIDVSQGHQPMTNEDGTVHIAYNGEIYNHANLRKELKTLGHRFRSTCDTEVIIHAYEQWGPEGCLSRLRGMFAFALWDETSQTLMLARDRMGIKPLYTAEWQGRLYFGSEMRAILSCSGMSRAPNLRALRAFLVAGHVPAPDTVFDRIQKLPPAHYLLAREGRISLHRYWTLSYSTFPARSREEIVERFREILTESVRMRLMSEVPLGALLSGGIDSTTVVGLMQGLLDRPVLTVSVGFESASFDESALALTSARQLGTDHHPISFTGDSMDTFPEALAAREEPLADATFVAMYKLFQACREQGLTVVLTGEGADELLGGYHWHRGEAMLRPLLKLPHAVRALLARAPLEHFGGENGERVKRILARPATHVTDRYIDWIGVGQTDLGDTILSGEVRAATSGTEVFELFDSWSTLVAELPECSPMQQMLWLQSRTRMIDMINHNVDRMSMAHSVEARPIFLDHTLWEFCATVPPDLLLHGSPLNLTEKYLLREATRGVIPEDVRRRKKKGLWVPTSGWLLRERLPDWAESALSSSALRSAGLFDPQAVVQLRREHQQGASGRGRLLIGVLGIQLWHAMFVESPGPGGGTG